MFYNQQYQDNNLNQQLLGQQDIPISVNQPNNGGNVQPENNNINTPFSYPQQINPQMNFPPQQINPQINIPPQQINPQMNISQQINSNNPYFPQGYPPNNQYYPPNYIKPEDLFEMQKRMLAGENVSYTNLFNKQQSNNYVLPPKNLYSGNKLIIPFTNCKNIAIEILMVITYLMVIASPISIILKICMGMIFLIEQICVLYYGKKRIEIVKDEKMNKLTVKLINHFGKARKTTEYDLSMSFLMFE